MPPTIVHAAVGALTGAAILGDDFDEWALIAVLLFSIFPDIDSFVALWIPGMHRTLLHNIWVVIIPATILFYFTRIRGTDFFERHN